MTVLAGVFAAGAALLHVYIWVLESFRWIEPATRKTFGVSEADAPVLAPMAYNQGFYNLFLAIAAVTGLVLAAQGEDTAGVAVSATACSVMLAAAGILLTTDKRFLAAAAIQGLPPLVALGLLGLI